MGNEKLYQLLTETSELLSEYRRRSKLFDTVSVGKELVDEYLMEGWEFDQELKFKTRLKKPKSIDERLENRLWVLLFRLGYPAMNKGRDFKVAIERRGANSLEKQVDVFAQDDETIIIVECKASNELKRRSLQKDIEEFGSLKRPISLAIRNHYGKNFKPKIIWLFATENIIWSAPDRERAKGLGIQIATERELRYYGQIADHLGSAARYQFLAEFLQGQRIPELKDKAVPAVRGKLGGKVFYSFVTTPRHLLKIAFVNHRSLNDPEGAPAYQRLVSKARMKKIGKFIEDGGFFPTNLLVNFIKKSRFDIVKKDDLAGATYGHLYLPDTYRSAWVVDGQHRLYGYAHLAEKFQDQNIMVVAFEGLKKEEEANLFVTINHEQKSVPKTLLDDLEGELKWGSAIPSERIGSIGARLIGVLNLDVGEPFYNRVTQQGIKGSDTTCLTIPEIKNGLRRSGLIGRSLQHNKMYDPGPFTGANDTLTLDRARTAINQYFSIIRERGFSHWEAGRSNYLCINVAIQAYLRLLMSLIEFMVSQKRLDPKELEPVEIIHEIKIYLQPVLNVLTKSTSADMEQKFKVTPGSGGPPEYYYRLCNIVQQDFPDFNPEGMKNWELEQSEENIRIADERLKELNIKVQHYIFALFRKKFGTRYWEDGLTDPDMKTNAYRKSLEVDPDDRLELEHYLDFIDYKKIVEKKQHWTLFKSVFDIPEPGEKGFAKNLKWMEQINELRRIPAHATEKRVYKAADFEYLDYIYPEFETKYEEGILQLEDLELSE